MIPFLLTISGNIEPSEVILNRIDGLLNRAPEEPNEHPLGYLTSENRNTWASLRLHLLDLGNQESLKLVDSALFCVCLDSDTTYNEKNPTQLIRNFLFGNAGNRWFDKSVSLLVAKDGTAAVNFEHSWGDGVAVMRYVNDVYREVTTRPIITADMTSSSGNAGDVQENVKRIGKIQLS